MREKARRILEATKASFPSQPPQWLNAVVISVLLSALTGVFSFFYGREQVAPMLIALSDRVIVLEQRMDASDATQTARFEHLLEELEEIKALVSSAHPINARNDE